MGLEQCSLSGNRVFQINVQITNENWNFVLHDAVDIQLKSKVYDKIDQFEKFDNIDNDADNPQYGIEISGNSGDQEDYDGIDYGTGNCIEDGTDNKGHGKDLKTGAKHSLTVTQENVLRYWRPKKREFSQRLTKELLVSLCFCFQALS